MRKIPNRMCSQIRLDEKLYAKVKIIAEREHRYMNSQMEYFIDQCVAQYEAEHGPIILPAEDQDED